MKGVFLTLVFEQILIVEEDRAFANRLIEALNALGPCTISIVPTVRDACFYLVQSRQDLAFIPIREGAKIIRSLRAVQPDLRLVLVTPEPDVEIPQTYAGRVQGVLIKSLLDVELPLILKGVLAQPLVGEDRDDPVTSIQAPRYNLIESTLQQTKLGRLIHTAVFIHNQTLVAHWGDLTQSEAAIVALQVGSDWLEHQAESRIQFMHIPARAGDMLLYTQEVNGQGDLVTLVGVAETPISELRNQAQRMARKLHKALKGYQPPQTSFLGDSDGVVDGRITYAIIWRPTEPLPLSIHIPLRRAMERIAAGNACILTHSHVQANIVHVVVNCPVGKESAWAAYLFKNGSEEAIRQEYGVAAHLWETGFYATESTNPLSDAEINLFLETHPLEK